jgi:hypothetical protein
MTTFEEEEDGSLVEKVLDVRLRGSQIKFFSQDLSLNVVRCATYSQGYLNRQLIILLSCLGVPDRVFMEMQAKAKNMASVKQIFIRLYEKTVKVFKSARKNKQLA